MTRRAFFPVRCCSAMLLTLFTMFFILHIDALSQDRAVDFRYRPSQYATVICFPADWQKTLVSERGALLYDFGPGPYARPLTEIQVGITGTDARIIRQTLEDARVPIIVTTIAAGGSVMRQRAYSLLPRNAGAVADPARIVQRMGGVNGCIAWASPGAGVDPAFQNVAWGTNRPITYRVRVDAGARKRVAMGVCESYKPRPGGRFIEFRVEGAEPVTIDPLVDGRQNKPHVVIIDAHDADLDGWLSVEAHASIRSPDPNVILNAFWVFPDSLPVTPDAVIRGEATRFADVYHDCGTEAEESAPSTRMDAISATVETGQAAPVVSIRTRRTLHFDAATGAVLHRGKPFIMARPIPLAMEVDGGVYTLTMPGGTRRVDVVVVNGSGHDAEPVAFPDLHREQNRTRGYWLSTAAFPSRPLVVPDSGLQYLLDANIRNMYQVADSVDGRFQFQPGPTVYRGLWLADVVLPGESALMLGDTLTARRFLEGAMRNQLASGQMRVMYPVESLLETPTFVHALCRYALWTGNREWLRAHWPVVTKGIAWIRDARAATLRDPTLPYSGLMPPGFVDGGNASVSSDYGVMLWAMIAIEKGIEAAQWLGEHRQADEWRTLFDASMSSFKKAARRDLHRDSTGHLYLPIIVGDTTFHAPQRAQCIFLLAVSYGSFFLRQDAFVDSLVRLNLAMLDDKKQEGLIVSSGWLERGVWPWQDNLHGIARHQIGDARTATDILYAVANHASPAGTWIEEQHVNTAGSVTTGDVSNAQASAMFIRFMRDLLVHERAEHLELLNGVPDEWIHPGALIEVHNGHSEFGPLTLSLRVAPDGRTGEITVSPIDGRGKKGRPVLVLAPVKRAGFTARDGTVLPDRLEGDWNTGIRLLFRKK